MTSVRKPVILLTYRDSRHCECKKDRPFNCLSLFSLKLSHRVESDHTRFFYLYCLVLCHNQESLSTEISSIRLTVKQSPIVIDPYKSQHIVHWKATITPASMQIMLDFKNYLKSVNILMYNPRDCSYTLTGKCFPSVIRLLHARCFS